MYRYKLGVAIFILLSLALLLASACTEQSCPELDGRAPSFSLSSLSGETAKLEDYRGKTVILNFWQTTCVYCKLQMPLLQEISDKYSSADVVVLAVNVGESAQRVQGYIDETGYKFTFLLDENRRSAQTYCIPALPFNVFIDKEGVIRNAKLGAFSSLAEIENYLKSFN